MNKIPELSNDKVLRNLNNLSKDLGKVYQNLMDMLTSVTLCRHEVDEVRRYLKNQIVEGFSLKGFIDDDEDV
jgi:regulator of replication initiation timing